MKITILSMFPNLLNSLFENPVVKRAVLSKTVELEVVDIKDFAEGSFRHIDDSPYGGSAGMILRADVLDKALQSANSENCYSVLLSPKGKAYNQETARRFASEKHLILICGHYEGVDAIFEKRVDELVSVGDFILTGGEGPAALIADSVIRLLDGVLKDGVTENESFENILLEHDQYTHPYEYQGEKVPDVLLSGNIKKIEKWKHENSIKNTVKNRPDLIMKYGTKCIGKSEQSLTDLFSKKDIINDNIIRYSDEKLPDMYDHNFFSFCNDVSDADIEQCITYQKERNQNWIKFESSQRMDQVVCKKCCLEEGKIIVMGRTTDGYKSIMTNPDAEIKNLHENDIAKDLIKIELENYGKAYGEDFVMRKMHRYLTEAGKKKRLNYFAAYLDGKIAGSVYAWVDNDCVAVDDLIVSKEFRKQKIATTLLCKCMELAPFIYLHADDDDTPKEMYKKLGFEEIGYSYDYYKALGK